MNSTPMEGGSMVLQEVEVPRPEVAEKPVRRRFTAEYKRKILAEADACSEPGALGELLRREGLDPESRATSVAAGGRPSYYLALGT